MSTYSKSFFRCMKECKDEISRVRNVEAGKVWLLVKSFVEGGEYSSYKKADEFSKLVIGGYTDEYIAKTLGIKEDTVRIHKRNISNELYNLLGNDFFELLLNYRENKKVVDARVLNISAFGLKSKDLFPEDVLALIGSSTIEPIKSIDLEECKKEISYLARHSINSMKKGAKTLDANKLHYVLGVIDAEVGTPEDRYNLLKLMTGGKFQNEND